MFLLAAALFSQLRGAQASPNYTATVIKNVPVTPQYFQLPQAHRTIFEVGRDTTRVRIEEAMTVELFPAEFHAFQAEVEAQASADLSVEGDEAAQYIPEPMSAKNFHKLPERVREGWKGSFRGEMNSLLDKKAFGMEECKEDDIVLPIKEIYKAKTRSDGRIDKLKTRFAIRGDLDKGKNDENNWAPTASFRLLRFVLAEAARLKCRVYQVDFVSAYLQANMDRRVFVILPAHWATIFPEYKEWVGKPLRLLKSVYGISSAGRLWSEEWIGWLVKDCGFRQSKSDPALFIYRRGRNVIVLISYVDDCAYFCTSDEMRRRFERKLKERFDCKILGQIHWFLQTRIRQEQDYSIILDQSRYAASMIARFLPNAEIVKPSDADCSKYLAPLPSGFVFTKEDRSVDIEAQNKLIAEFGFEYPSAVGCCIWLLNGYPRLQFAVRKLARFMQLPGRKHYQALIHLLHHVRCHHKTGTKFYSDFARSPIHEMLRKNNITFEGALFLMTDSSWQDCVDTGRSTGGYLIFYQGGVIDASSNMPDPIAMSSAESEYNQACVGAMAVSHVRQLMLEARGLDPDTKYAVPLLIDNTAAIAIGSNFRDTQHTRHILRRFHYVRWQKSAGFLFFIYVNTDLMVCDPMTKNLPGTATTLSLFRKTAEVPVDD